MKRLLFAISFFVIYSCNNDKLNPSKLSDFIPQTSDLVLKINQASSFKTDWINNGFVQKFGASEIHKTVESQLKNLDLLQTDSPILIGFESEKDSLKYTIATKFNDSLFNVKAIDSADLHHKIIDSVLILSNAKSRMLTLETSYQRVN